MAKRVIHLRVDVDFNEGLRRGVPFLLDLFERLEMRATFYVVMGPDTLHRHALRMKGRAFRRRGSSLSYGKILRHLGWAFLKSRFLSLNVACDHPDLLRGIERRGHELGVHGFDHAAWADGIFRMGEAETRGAMDRAFFGFRKLLGKEPTTWGAPNWRSNEHMFSYLEKEEGILFASDARGKAPFFPAARGRTFKVLELPVSLPCLHELVHHGCRREEIPGALLRCLSPDFNLLCIHDYYEGMLERELFRECVERLRRDGWAFRPLGELARALDRQAVGPEEVRTVLVPGGVGPVSCQASFLEKNYFQALGPPSRVAAQVPARASPEVLRKGMAGPAGRASPVEQGGTGR